MKQTAEARPAIYLSDGKTPQGAALAERDTADGGGYDLNFENAPVATVAKVVLGDLLGVGYTIDPRVQGGDAGLRSSDRQGGRALRLENALRMSNVAMVRDGAVIACCPPTRPSDRRRRQNRLGRRRPGTKRGSAALRVRAKCLQAARRIRRQANTIRPDAGRNTLIIQGSGADRAAAIDTILSFDADWMRGQSVGIFPIRNSSPEPVIPRSRRSWIWAKAA